jgi:sigma-B regulation protein RsbU (phosphoserine phosphatase)
MVETLTEFRLEALSGASVSEIFERLNSRFLEKATLGMFVTLCYVVIDFKTGKAEIANAGHLPIYKGGGKNLKKISGHRTSPFGILPSLDLQTEEFFLKNGESVFLITDGVIEARNAQGEEYGSDRFEKYLGDVSSVLPLPEIVEGFFSELDRFRGHFAIPDDVTFLAAKFKG